MTFLLNLFNQKNKSIKHANSLINIVLFTTEDYGFYTDLYSFIQFYTVLYSLLLQYTVLHSFTLFYT